MAEEKKSGVEGSLNDMSVQLDKMTGLVDQLEQRLNAVMSTECPSPTGDAKEMPTVSPLRARIWEYVGVIEAVNAKTRSMLDRLEL